MAWNPASSFSSVGISSFEKAVCCFLQSVSQRRANLSRLLLKISLSFDSLQKSEYKQFVRSFFWGFSPQAPSLLQALGNLPCSRSSYELIKFLCFRAPSPLLLRAVDCILWKNTAKAVRSHPAGILEKSMAHVERIALDWQQEYQWEQLPASQTLKCSFSAITRQNSPVLSHSTSNYVLSFTELWHTTSLDKHNLLWYKTWWTCIILHRIAIFFSPFLLSA